jgi:phosphoglycolate phosphatase-like HAD superfamily hydrolase
LILKALRDLNATPENTFFIGDSADDMEAARAAGCTGLYVGPPHPSYTAITFPEAAETVMATIGR